MEIVNGDYGDVIPKLVQSVLNGQCDAYNNRYKACLPKRYPSSLQSNTAKSDKDRNSNSHLSTASSNQGGAVICGSLDSSMNGKVSSYGDGTDIASSRESSEEVS